MRTQGTLNLLLPLLLAGALTAQGPLFKVAQKGGGFPYVQDYAFACAGDYDGDGDVDVFLGCSYNQNRLFFNDGKGKFTEVTRGRIPVGNFAFCYQGGVSGDVDGDGDLDLLVTHGDWVANQPSAELWLNDGKGKFTATTGKLPAFKARPVMLFDADGDKDLDIAYGCSGTQNGLLINNGSGVFTDKTATNMPVDTDHTFTMAYGDVDGDGDMDMVAGNYQNRAKPWVDRLYINNGSGVFSFATNFPTTVNETRSLNLFDWDEDGDLDLILGQGSHYGPANDILYLNDGAGLFTLDTTGMLPVTPTGPRAYVVADFDQDKHLDLFAPGTGQARLLHNKGLGVFTDITTTNVPVDTNRTRTSVGADFDGDGDVDVIASSGNEMRLLVNNGGKLSFRYKKWLPHFSVGAEFSILGDVDGDGDLDAFFGCYPTYKDISSQNKLFLNDGNGNFSAATAGRLPVDGDPTCCGVFVDVDGDKDLDIVYGNEGGGNKLYLNDGKGYFTDATVGRIPVVGTDLTYGLEAGDVDGDGDIDLVMANGPAWWTGDTIVRLLLNDGTGTFTDASTSNLPTGLAKVARGLELGDLDGDGDLDLVVGVGFFTAGGDQNLIYMNDGKGIFTDATVGNMPVISDETNDLVLGDVDGDGDLDLYEATGIRAFNYTADRFYLNDGKGKFTLATHLLPAARMQPDASFCTIMEDFDGDGDIDIYSAKAFHLTDVGSQSVLFINDGTGNFTDGTGLIPAGNEHANGITAGDVDGDGDLDLLAACYYEPQLYFNLSRHVWAPGFAVAGKHYPIQTYSRPANGRERRWALTMIATKSAHIKTYCGILGLSPWKTIFFRWRRTNSMTSMATSCYRVPNHPCMVGMQEFFLQAKVQVDGKCWWLRWAYTNVIQEEVFKK